ncbi:hypothetical protein CUC08_Gglean008134 [Alternaria sp. MG1]|nr:hypothetical protein CUC08_Gglean008134 [Alternaria sp. MG1]
MKDNQGLTEALTATRELLIAAEMSTNSAVSLIRFEGSNRTGPARVKALEVATFYRGEVSSRELDLPIKEDPGDAVRSNSDCLEPLTLMAVRDQIGGILANVFKDE